MNKFETRQVVMLPTSYKSSIYIDRDNKIYLNILELTSCNNHYNQHLYILSDEPIKEGDWVICVGADIDDRFPFNGAVILKYTGKELGVSKIIATTDSSLIFKLVHSNPTNFNSVLIPEHFPQPSQEWIKYFIEQYNKGNFITEVEVEYEHKQCKTLAECNCKTIAGDLILKINSDNTINIKFPVEEDWNEIYNQYDYYMSSRKPIKTALGFKEWLKENYNPPTKK